VFVYKLLRNEGLVWFIGPAVDGRCSLAGQWMTM